MNNQFAFLLFWATAMRKGMSRLCLALCSLGLVLSANAQEKGTIITFDAPGAGTVYSPVCAPYCGTIAYANNNLELIVGSYTDANIVPHGFLREPNGHITSFDAPGAGLGAGLNEGTVAYAITDEGVIVGQYQDSNLLFHGFVRYVNGSFTTFEAPDAGTGANQGTLAWDINWAGTIAGTYIDGSGVYHGFLRSPRGTFTSFDPPGSIFTYPCEETCLSPDGTLTGFYLDSEYALHGFERTPDGNITTIDAPGAYLGSVAASIAAGAIAGYFIDADGMLHGFLRARAGTFTTFAVPGSLGTVAYSINASQWVTGVYIDANSAAHGFIRFPNGSFATIDAAGSSTSGAPNGTRPSTNNLQGAVAGWFWDDDSLSHGFMWTPFPISQRTSQ